MYVRIYIYIDISGYSSIKVVTRIIELPQYAIGYPCSRDGMAFTGISIMHVAYLPRGCNLNNLP